MRWQFPRPTDPATAFLSRLRPSRGARGLVRPLVRGMVAGCLLMSALVTLRVFAFANIHEVRPGQLYRTAQMTPDRLRTFIGEHGIKTVVNLRGCCAEMDWYRDECRVTHELNVAQEDVTLSAIRMPSPTEIRRLVEVLERSERPLLFHCRQGVDRTGLAATVVELLDSEMALPDAERQLGLGFGYLAVNGTENMRRFFDLYRDWLSRMGVVHSSKMFRRWAVDEYCPGRCRARLEWLRLRETAWPADKGGVMRMRAHNTSVEPWHLRPGTRHGVHVRYGIGGSGKYDGRAGLFEATVPVGQSIDFELGIPPLPPGDYTITAHLIDEDENAFCQFGIPPLVHEFRVRP